jgi:hypothetical protein
MVLLLEDDVVMKRLLCCCCIDAVSNVQQQVCAYNIRNIVCGRKKFVEAASSTLKMTKYVHAFTHKRESQEIHITNGKDVNAVENVSTYAHKTISC